MKKHLRQSFKKIHKIILGSDAGKNSFVFAKNVSVSLIGGLSAFLLLFVASVVAARILGPEEYGKYSVFISIAQFLSLFFVLELDVSALYFLTKKTVKKKRIVSAILFMFIMNIVVFSLLAISGYRIMSFNDITLPMFMGIIILACIFALKRMIDAFLRCEGKFITQAILRFCESLAVVGTLLFLLMFIKSATYISYVQSVVIGGMLFSIMGFFVLRGFFHFSLDHEVRVMINKVFHYNSYGLINALVNGVVKNADKVLVATLLGLSVAGTYAVYFMAAVVIGARITQIVMNVFFPSVRSDASRIARIYHKINVLCMKLFVPLVICAGGGVWMIVSLYGGGFERSLLWISLGGLYIAVHFFASLYGWLLASISRFGYKTYNTSFIYGFIGYGAILFFGLMLNNVTIATFLCALITYRFIAGVVCFWSLRSQATAL
jgi:O-antigen/teichoic acid export membrane protein